MPELDSIQLETGPNPDAAVIWLHGLGADGSDFAGIVPQLQLPSEISIRFIFPHAPIRPITLNQGYQMPGWYDLTSLNLDNEEDEAGIEESSQAIHSLCKKQESLGIASGRIILAGFSQGGAIALHCGLNYDTPLGGIMALSTYLPHSCDLKNNNNQTIDIFMAHGQQDDVLDYNFGDLSRQRLEKSGYTVNWHDYVMQHGVCPEEIQDIRNWLIGNLAL